MFPKKQKSLNTSLLRGLLRSSTPFGSLFTPRDLFLRSRVTIKSTQTILAARYIKNISLNIQKTRTKLFYGKRTQLKYKLPFSNRLKKLRTLFSRKYLNRRRKNFLKKANRFYTKLKRKGKNLNKLNKLNKSSHMHALSTFYNDSGFTLLKNRKTRNRLLWLFFLKTRLIVNFQKRSILKQKSVFFSSSLQSTPISSLKLKFIQFYLNY